VNIGEHRVENRVSSQREQSRTRREHQPGNDADIRRHHLAEPCSDDHQAESGQRRGDACRQLSIIEHEH
jgi:hypothetical protein